MTAAIDADRQDWFAATMSREPEPVVAVEGGGRLPSREPAADPDVAAPLDDWDNPAAGRVDEPGPGFADAAGVAQAGTVRALLSEDPSARRVLIGLAAGLVVAVVAVAATMMSLRCDPAPAREEPAVAPPSVEPVSPVADPAVAPPVPPQDQAIGFTAASACPAGSTSAQSLAEPTPEGAWVCVRGPQGGQVDGQVLHIDFGRSYLISAVSVTPGWVPATPGGRDEWLAHRVVSRLQYIFNDPDRTVWVQQTGDVHGPVTSPLPRRVLASAVTVVILQTARPPAAPAPVPAPPGPGAAPGFGDSVLGAGELPPPGDPAVSAGPDPGGPNADPVDATFAISSVSFFGHQPN